MNTRLSVPYGPGTLHTSLKSTQIVGCASTHFHVSYDSKPHLPVEVGSGTVTCPTVSGLASQLRWAPLLPRVLWLRTSPPSWGGLWHCHVSYDFGPRLPVEVGSDTTTCPAGPNGLWASSIKKSLATLPMQLGTHARKFPKRLTGPARYVGRQRSQCMQGMQTDSYSATIVHRQHYGPLAWHRYSDKRLNGTVPHYWPSAAWHAIRPSVSTPMKTSFATPNH
jgi:hypothetical protein